MTVEECMRRMTYREFLVRVEWNNLQWNKPTLSDHYLMVIACEVRRVLSKNPRDVRLKDFFLKFESQKPRAKRPPEDLAKEVENQKMAWFAGLGIPAASSADSPTPSTPDTTPAVPAKPKIVHSPFSPLYKGPKPGEEPTQSLGSTQSLSVPKRIPIEPEPPDSPYRSNHDRSAPRQAQDEETPELRSNHDQPRALRPEELD